MENKKEPIEVGSEEELTELMQAHLEDVAGGAGHNSWKQTHFADDDQLK